MQQIKNLKIRIWIYLSILGVIWGGCDSLIYDNLSDCPQGVYVKFYSMTPCDTDSTFIGNVPTLSVFAFDESDKLVVMHKEENASLTQDFEVLMPVSNGNYHFVAWAGVYDNFTVESFTPGSTTKQDVMMTLKMNDSKATQLGDHKVWQGESRTVHLPNPAISGAQFRHTAVNLRELTNRINITVKFDREQIEDESTEDLEIELKSANGTLHIDGRTNRKAGVMEYPARDIVLDTDSVSWSFTTLDLITGLHNNLKLSLGIDDEGNEKIVFSNDLIASILLRANDEGGISLDCENDFDVKFTIKDYCKDCPTYFSCYISIKEWGMHSYEIEVGGDF